jgi:ATP-binding cassette subfamily C protein
MINKLKIILNKKQQVYALLLFVGICISSILEMVGVGSIPLFINLLLKPEQLISHFPQIDFVIFFASRDYLYQILFGATILLVIFSLKNFFLFCIIYLQAILLKNINIENSKRLFQSYLQSPYSFHLNRNSATISRNVTTDVGMSSRHLDNYIYVVREILVIVVIFTLLLMNLRILKNTLMKKICI